jgi:flagellar biosynthesis protein FliQ
MSFTPLVLSMIIAMTGINDVSVKRYPKSVSIFLISGFRMFGPAPVRYQQ